MKNHPEDYSRFVETIIEAGYPVAKILETSDRLNVDVIIMGTHGKGLINHALLGSTSEKVLKKSLRPVFIIPLPH